MGPDAPRAHRICFGRWSTARLFFTTTDRRRLDMLVIPGRRCHTCEGPTRRELLRAGSIGMLGLNLANFFAWQKSASAAKYEGARGFGSAKSVIMVFLQGGPSHVDIWDPKPDAPANIRGEFKPIKTKIPGTQISETMPMMAEQLDKCTLIRSMSYTPNGLFNHTAAIVPAPCSYSRRICSY